jgi:hypothetical protein
MNLTDLSLEGFIDCSLYEETATFFRAPGDDGSLVDIGDLAAAPPPSTLAPVPALLPSTAGSGVAAGATPLPMLAHDEAPVPADPAPPPPRPHHPSPVLAPRATGSPPAGSAPALRPASRFTGRRRLLIGGVAAGACLLVLVIVLAAGGGHGGRSASASPATDPVPVHEPDPRPAITTSPSAPVVQPTGAVTPPTNPPAVIKAKLTIELKPEPIAATAKILVDGAEIKDGVIELPLGDAKKKEVTVAVKASGYNDVETKIEIEGDRTVTIELVKRSTGGGLKRPPLRGGVGKKQPPRGGLSDI